MFKLAVGIAIAALLGAGGLFAHLYLGVKLPGLDVPTVVQPTSPKSGAIRKSPAKPSAAKRDALAARKPDYYAVDATTLDLAKRAAASIGRRNRLSADLVRLYKDIIIRAERACRFRNIEACWHRGQFAELAREPNPRKWTQKARLFAEVYLRKCKNPSAECSRIEKIVKAMK